MSDYYGPSLAGISPPSEPIGRPEHEKDGSLSAIVTVLVLLLLLFLALAGFFGWRLHSDLRRIDGRTGDLQVQIDDLKDKDSKLIAEFADLNVAVDELQGGDSGLVQSEGGGGTDSVGPQGAAGQAGADGSAGAAGSDGTDGADGATGPAGPAGADGQDGQDGADGCTGDCVALQASSPGTAQTGHLNISGIGIAGTAFQAPLFDTATAAGLGIGNTNATSVSICNSAACDTISIGTNADADAINIGDANDTVTITGNSSSTFVLDGVTLSTAELNILDGGLIDSEISDTLTIDSSSSVDWTALTNYPAACAAGSAVSTLADVPTCTAFNTDTSVDLDNVYDNDSDKQLDVDSASGLTFDLTTTGDFIIENNGSPFATFDDNGAITFGGTLTFSGPATDITTGTDEDLAISPNGTGDIVFSLDDDTSVLAGGTITGTTSQNLFNIEITNWTTSGDQHGLVVLNHDQFENTFTTEALAWLVNNESDAAASVTNGLLISGVAGGGLDTIVDAIDVSDDNITNALNIGSNNIVTSGATISSTELDALDGGLSLDEVYDADSDKELLIDSATGLIFDMTTTGDFVIQDSNTTIATFDDSGGITIAPNSTSDVTVNGDDDSSLIINGTLANDSVLQDINLTLGNDGGGDSVVALNIDVTSAATGDADEVLGLALNVSSPDSTVHERALHIGANWDYDIAFADATPTVAFRATDNTTDMSWIDSSGNNLFQFKDLSTNFGAYAETGAFIDRNSYFGEEWMADRATDTASAATTWGDHNEFSVQEQTATSNDCSFYNPPNRVNGIGRLQTADASTSCVAFTGLNSSATTPKGFFDVNNLPVIIMKAAPNAADANSRSRLGIGFLESDTVASGQPPANEAIYFTNATDSNASWSGVTISASTNTTVGCTGQTVSTGTTYNLLKIEVVSATEVKFYVDNDVSNGISWTLCGTSTTNIPTALLAGFTQFNSATNGNVLDVDFFRVWQDDAPVSEESSLTQSGSYDPPSGPLTFESAPADFNPNVILADLFVASENMQYDPQQRLDTQVMVASKGVITPELTADKIAANSIEAATGEGIQINSDVTVNGTLTADKIKANQIEGLEVFTSKISSLEDLAAQAADSGEEPAAQEQPPEQPADAPAEPVNITELGDVSIKSAKVTLDLTASGGLTVGGPAEFKGTSIFHSLASFIDRVVFRKDVDFLGTPNFNSDTGGFATIKTGDRKVKVVFTQPYAVKPVVTTNIVNGRFTEFANKDLTASGFTIVLKEPAEADIEFTWTALSVQSPRTGEESTP